MPSLRRRPILAFLLQLMWHLNLALNAHFGGGSFPPGRNRAKYARFRRTLLCRGFPQTPLPSGLRPPSERQSRSCSLRSPLPGSSGSGSTSRCGQRSPRGVVLFLSLSLVAVSSLTLCSAPAPALATQLLLFSGLLPLRYAPGPHSREMQLRGAGAERQTALRVGKRHPGERPL
jgi:hypothetical protein